MPVTFRLLTGDDGLLLRTAAWANVNWTGEERLTYRDVDEAPDIRHYVELRPARGDFGALAERNGLPVVNTGDPGARPRVNARPGAGVPRGLGGEGPALRGRSPPRGTREERTVQPLDADALPTLAAVLPVPSYDRSRLRTGIVHLGVGGFVRSHLAAYVDLLLEQGRAQDWAVCGVGVLASDRGWPT